MEERVLDMDASDNDRRMATQKCAEAAPDRKNSFSHVPLGTYWMLPNDVGLSLRAFEQEELDYLQKSMACLASTENKK